jgi:hypothetical protein
MMSRNRIEHGINGISKTIQYDLERFKNSQNTRGKNKNMNLGLYDSQVTSMATSFFKTHRQQLSKNS